MTRNINIACFTIVGNDQKSFNPQWDMELSKEKKKHTVYFVIWNNIPSIWNVTSNAILHLWGEGGFNLQNRERFSSRRMRKVLGSQRRDRQGNKVVLDASTRSQNQPAIQSGRSRGTHQESIVCTHTVEYHSAMRKRSCRLRQHGWALTALC